MLHKRHRVVQQLYHPQAEHVQPELSMVIDSHGFTPVDSELNQQVTQACKPLRPSSIVSLHRAHIVSSSCETDLPWKYQGQTVMLCAEMQPTAYSVPEPLFRQEATPVLQDPYARHVTEEGLSVQTLQPPAPDAAQAVAGRIRRARAALAARTHQMHGPLPMPPRKLLPRPDSPAPEQLPGNSCASCLACLNSHAPSSTVFVLWHC